MPQFLPESDTPTVRRAWLAFALAVGALFLLPTLSFPFGYDQGIVHHLGRSWTRGLWPYADVWDTSFPGGVIIHSIATLIGADSPTGIRWFDFGWQLATLCALFVAVSAGGGAAAGFFSALAYAGTYTWFGYYDTAQRDTFLALPLVVGLRAFHLALERRGYRSLTLAGLMAGLIVANRPTYGLLVLAGCIALLWPRTTRSLGDRFQRGLIFGAVASLPMLLFIVVYVATGRSGALIDLLGAITTVYPHLESVSFGAILAESARSVPWMLWIGAGIALLFAWPSTRVYVAASLVALLVRFIERKGYEYQFWPITTALAMAAPIGWSAIGQRIALPAWLRRAPLASLWWMGVPLALQLLLNAHPYGYRTLRSDFVARRDTSAFDRSYVADNETQASLARYLREHTREGDRIQLWGPMTGVLIASTRQSATRFSDPFLLFCEPQPGVFRLFRECPSMPGAAFQQKIVEELTAAWGAHPPAYFALHYADASLQVEEGPCLAPDLPELRALLDREYVLEATFGKWQAWRHRAAPTANTR